MSVYHIGLDIGSTTMKVVVLNENNNSVYTYYERHSALIRHNLLKCLGQIESQIGNVECSLNITGSIGMGIAEQYGWKFVQEVIAATKYIVTCCQSVETMIDIGGEDAKIVLFKNNEAVDLRMNGNCAGGTGAFIDQMAILLGVTVNELANLALKSGHIYPLASRCGVFCKTDIQNLIAKNVCKEDIAASIFHAIAVQTVTTLAHGCSIKTPILFIGGPLTFIPALRNSFIEYLKINIQDIILPSQSELIPAWGSALLSSDGKLFKLHELILCVEKQPNEISLQINSLPPLFTDDISYQRWKLEKSHHSIKKGKWKIGEQKITIGIDSGSTTTKIVALDSDSRMLFQYYSSNEGNPIAVVEKGLNKLLLESKRNGTDLKIVGSCSTGYGEDLIRVAFRLNGGIIETMAHYVAARHFKPDVTFILDIGGQDMKAIFVDNGIINQIEINEACSSGCGSFIETFAQSLGFDIESFSQQACICSSACDLGTRCTVFMNSKVKQVLREGVSVASIATGLSYSVVKNCLYKVLKLKETNSLGEHIVVQGGTMKNDSIVRAFELLTGKQVFRSDNPELMGAFGCALHAQQINDETKSIEDLLQSSHFTSVNCQCKGCENQCMTIRYQFDSGNFYYSGNRCEKIFTNKGNLQNIGTNVYEKKLHLLFDRSSSISEPLLTIGIPRCLNMYEEYPFWHTLFTNCGIRVQLSSESTFQHYESGIQQIMSDNICFPAKLVHSHIQDLIDKNVDRIFMPFVVFEKIDGNQNSYNCPIVSGYSQVIKHVQNKIKIDFPSVSFKNIKLLYKQCHRYLIEQGVSGQKIRTAFKKAIEVQADYEKQIMSYNHMILKESRKKHRQVILLAGRPYHADSLIQHKLSEMIAAMGADVITDDIVRGSDIQIQNVHFVTQWAYTNRILKAAEWVTKQQDSILFMQMTSFGCGPDAFLTDEVSDLLKRNGKSYTLLKIDDVNNIGSLKLRVRSTLESIKNGKSYSYSSIKPFADTPVYGKERKSQKMIAPFFTPFISPLMPDFMKLSGYDMDILPVSDKLSIDLGLKYANNEVCYPATLIVGDIIKAFNEKKYNALTTSVVITQTGGQCRASNYISLIKKALIEAGYDSVPVVSFSFGSGLSNLQPGFSINWIKMLPIALTTILYSDCIAKFYFATIVREKHKGKTDELLNYYLNVAKQAVSQNNPDKLFGYLKLAASDFNDNCTDKDCSKVGLVGEIFLKFNPFAQKNITNWIINQNIEVIPPLLTDFFLQSFVNYKVNKENKIERSLIPDFIIDRFYKKVQKQIFHINRIGQTFRHFIPFHDIFDKAVYAEKVISLQSQFGEGWLLPAEIISCLNQGVNHVISLQPFGCIANHIVAKGIENGLKKLYPELNMLSLDFDSGVSDVNIINRMLLFIDKLKR